jgi:cytosine/adenosine deaminase-related metal-dependent hydrolase
MTQVKPILIHAGTILTMDAERRVIERGGVIVEGGEIRALLTPEEFRETRRTWKGEQNGEIVDRPEAVLCPGFIQTHIHLCQTLFRGLAEDLPLLDWLRLRIYPLEAAHSAASMRASAALGTAELLASGTTTIMDMGSVRHEEEIVRVIEESGIRAFVGKAMMDENAAFPRLKEPTREAIRTTREQAEAWHGRAGGRIMYAVAPRFILSCSDELLRAAGAMASAIPGMLFHTHAAENRSELEAVRTRCGMDNIEYFDSLGILGENTCLAHCVWLSEREFDLMAERRAAVLHCPSSNLKLGSGIARVPEMLRRGITVSLGADGAPCNNRLDMFAEMRLAALIQKPLEGPGAMPAEEVLALATNGGARALGCEGMLGSIEKGKKADLLLLDLRKPWNPADPRTPGEWYTSIVHSGTPANVEAVMVDGAWVYRDGTHLRLDSGGATLSARVELRKLLDRVEWQ